MNTKETHHYLLHMFKEDYDRYANLRKRHKFTRFVDNCVKEIWDDYKSRKTTPTMFVKKYSEYLQNRNIKRSTARDAMKYACSIVLPLDTKEKIDFFRHIFNYAHGNDILRFAIYYHQKMKEN